MTVYINQTSAIINQQLKIQSFRVILEEIHNLAFMFYLHLWLWQIQVATERNAAMTQ